MAGIYGGIGLHRANWLFSDPPSSTPVKKLLVVVENQFPRDSAHLRSRATQTLIPPDFRAILSLNSRIAVATVIWAEIYGTFLVKASQFAADGAVVR
jgi:hypothetical protein